jgi:hypothetical protein
MSPRRIVPHTVRSGRIPVVRAVRLPLLPGCPVCLGEFGGAKQPNRAMHRCGAGIETLLAGVLVQESDIMVGDADA